MKYIYIYFVRNTNSLNYIDLKFLSLDDTSLQLDVTIFQSVIFLEPLTFLCSSNI